MSSENRPFVPTPPAAGPEQFRHQMDVLRSGFLDNPEVQFLLDAVTQPILIVNAQRQVVYANRPASQLLGAGDASDTLAQKPGELLHCARAAAAPGGCGTSFGCRFCGVAQAVIEAMGDRTSNTKECRLLRSDGNGLVLEIHAKPLHLSGETFTVLSLTDLGPLKHREALEHTFFHDVLNTASTLLINGEFMMQEAEGSLQTRTARVVSVTRRLIEEIRAQRLLLQAERGEVTLRREPVLVHELVASIAEEYGDANARRNLRVAVHPDSQPFTVQTDTVLLARILCNLVKNACEASKAGDLIQIRAQSLPGRALFEVSNPGFIPPEIQCQLFTRSFSTKGTGRGLGTYGSRLFTERYLNGSIGFRSTPEEGTTFFVDIPG